jgi:hypothetical protein
LQKSRRNVWGKYPVYTGAAAGKALQKALKVSPEAKQFIKDYLKDRFGVELK